ncbi:unnamed protein product, partial [Porites lobata]
LQSIPNFASKIVTNSRKFDHVTPFLRELNWLPVKEQLFYRDSMLYCSSVWSNTTLQNINRLQSIQNFASKIVTNSRKFDHVTPLLRELNWLPVKEQL